MGTIADLKVVIGSDITKLDSGLDQATAKVNGFSTKVSRIGDTAGSGFSAAGTKVNQFGDTVDATGNKATGLGSKLGNVGQIAGGFLAANVIGRGFSAFSTFISDSIQASSNLGESINAVTKVFGSSQQKILDWGKNNAVSFGLSQRAFNELATPLGAGLRNAGLSMDQVADNTINLTKRAADMASVFNTSVPDALEAIQSGLRGEADPLEKYGVGLSAAKVQAQAFADTGKTAAASLTTQELALARVKLIMDQTNTSAGDFQATSDGYANSQRIAAAKTEELQAKIGDKLVPVMLKLNQVKLALVTVIADKLLPVLGPLIDFAAKNPVLLAILAGVIGGVLIVALTAWAVSATVAAFATLGLTWPIIAVIGAIGLLVAAVVWVIKNWDWLAEKATQVWNFIWGIIGGTMRAIGAVFSAGLQFIVDLFMRWTLPGLIIRHWDSILAGARWLGDTFMATMRWMVDTANNILSWFGRLPRMFFDWFGGIGVSVAIKINELMGWVSGISGRVMNALGNLRTFLYNSGVALVSGFWDGIVSRWDQMVDWVRRGMSNLRDLWPFSEAKTGPFSGRGYVTYSGRALTSDFADSIVAGIPQVVSAAFQLASAARISLTLPQPMVHTPAAVEPAMLSSARGLVPSGGSRDAIVLEFRGEGALVEFIRKTVRIHGGNIQAAFGRN